MSITTATPQNVKSYGLKTGKLLKGYALKSFISNFHLRSSSQAINSLLRIGILIQIPAFMFYQVFDIINFTMI
jgi:hypothetical protein